MTKERLQKILEKLIEINKSGESMCDLIIGNDGTVRTIDSCYAFEQLNNALDNIEYTIELQEKIKSKMTKRDYAVAKVLYEHGFNSISYNKYVDSDGVILNASKTINTWVGSSRYGHSCSSSVYVKLPKGVFKFVKKYPDDFDHIRPRWLLSKADIDSIEIIYGDYDYIYDKPEMYTREITNIIDNVLKTL